MLRTPSHPQRLDPKLNDGMPKGRELNLIRLSALLLGASSLVACQSPPNEACDQARADARQAALQGSVPDAKAALELARSSCDSKLAYDLSRIEQLILRRVERERELKERAELLQSQRRPLDAFVQWVGQLRESSSKSLEGEVCAARGHVDFGFCTGKKTLVDDAHAEVRYSATKPAEVFAFSTHVRVPIRCDELAESRIVREWTHGNEQFVHCEFTGPPLKGLGGLIRSPAPSASAKAELAPAPGSAASERPSPNVAEGDARPNPMLEQGGEAAVEQIEAKPALNGSREVQVLVFSAGYRGSARDLAAILGSSRSH